MAAGQEKFTGKREAHAWGEESSYGTETSSYEFSFGKNPTFENNRDDEGYVPIRGTGRDDIDVDKEEGPKSRGGTFSFAPQDWRWLKHVVGNGSSDVTDSDQGSYHKHTFSLNTTVSSFSYLRYHQHSSNAEGIVYLGSQVNSASISFEASEGEEASLIGAEVSIWAQDTDTTTTNSVPEEPDTDAYQFRNAILTVAGTERVSLLGGTVNIENNLNPARYANYSLDRKKDESNPQERRVNGSFRVHHDKLDYFKEMENTGPVSGTNELQLKRGTNDRLVAGFKRFKIEKVTESTNLEGNNEVRVEWSAVTFTELYAEDQISSY